MFESRVFQTPESLAAYRESWNGLWERSDSHSARSRYESLDLFVKHFGRQRDLHVATVFDGQKMVAALPLLIGKKKGVPVAELPNCSWSYCGDFLLDQDYYQPAVIDSLMEGVNQAPVLATWLDWIDIGREKWNLFQTYLLSHRYAFHGKERFKVAVINVPESAEQFQSSQSKNHRKKMRKASRLLHQLGDVELVDYDRSDLQHQLDIALDMEHRGWKGEQGSSIRACPEMESYFRELATALHRTGCFALQFLVVAGKPIAYDMGSLVKGVRASQKVSFDPEFAKYSPGQVLVGMQMEQAIDGNSIRQFDTIGPTTDAIRKWTSESYPMGRLFLSNQRWTSKLSVRAMSQLAKTLNRLKSPGITPSAGVSPSACTNATR